MVDRLLKPARSPPQQQCSVCRVITAEEMTMEEERAERMENLLKEIKAAQMKN